MKPIRDTSGKILEGLSEVHKEVSKQSNVEFAQDIDTTARRMLYNEPWRVSDTIKDIIRRKILLNGTKTNR